MIGTCKMRGEIRNTYKTLSSEYRPVTGSYEQAMKLGFP